MIIKRTHDKFYLKENRKQETKEYFKFVDKILKKKYNLKKNKNLEIIDVGCATGEFLFFLKNKYPNLNLSGMDIMSDLIDKAKKDVKDVKFHVGDVTNPKKYLKKKFDIVIFMGVHSIWDDPNDWFPFLLKLCKKKGRLYIFGLFNPNPVDTFVKIRRSNSLNTKQLEPGWNLISLETYKKYFKSKTINYIF